MWVVPGYCYHAEVYLFWMVRLIILMILPTLQKKNPTPGGSGASAAEVRNSLILQTLNLGDGIDVLLDQLASKSMLH